MSLENDPIVAEFVIESREHMADIENQLLAFEAAGADIDEDLVNTVFRAVHSIKGASGFLGFTILGKLAHKLENVFNLIRNRELVPDSTNVDVMLKAADSICEMIEEIDESENYDIDHHVVALQQITDAVENPDNENAAPPAAASAVDPSTTTSVPAPAEPLPQSAFQPLALEPEAPVAPVVAQTPVKPAPAKKTEPAPKEKQRSASTSANATPADSNIRVSVGLLDNLMNLAGELVLSRNQLLQKVEADGTAELDSVAARLDLVTSELQEAIMQTRMQAIGTVFGKFPRVVRDLSRQLGKQCELTIKGEEVELDKSIIEAIGDPLTHLIRNSVDHGVETPQVRVAAGKPAKGTVILNAFHRAGKVNISISDDGAGIDAVKLKDKAVERGILTADQAAQMSDREAVRLIFHPGFSMAKEVTDVSGRGVGMDVVKTNIEKLGGAVSIETTVGKGTTINVKLPLTLAIVPSLIVRSGERCLAIPQTNIRELVRVKKEDVATRIERVKDAEVFRLRGKLLPLLRLNDALGVNQTDETNNAINIIVVEAGSLQYGLIVDGLHDSEEIVVKPLGRHMQECETLAGATILGDGQVALILDVSGIASHCELTWPEDDELAKKNGSSDDDEETQASLLFSNHVDEQFGVKIGRAHV